MDIVSTNTGTIIAGDKYLVLAGPIVSNSLTYTTGQVFTASTTTFYGGIVSLINSTDVTKLFLTDYENLGDKQYLFHCPYYQLPGLYWNDGATCDQSIDPLSCIEFNRVANKEVANLLSFLALMKGMNVPIDTKTGLVSYSFTHAKEADFASAYIDPLVVSNDISGGNLSLIGTPNGVNTVNWTYVLTINGEPITGNATGTVVFSNS